MNYELMALARRAAVVKFSYPLDEKLEKEIKDERRSWRGGLVLFPNGELVVRLYCGGKQRIIAKFPLREVVAAARFADMATIYFAKYKRKGMTTAESIEHSPVFNGSFAQAKIDLGREEAAMDLLIQLERYLKSANLLDFDPQNPAPKAQINADRLKSQDDQIARLSVEVSRLDKKLEDAFAEIFKLQANVKV